ncbi:MAG: TrkH family potassium uptake protein [Geminicoccaceae bacterium]|nr:TrkH family potassium uptake protein [Geminicoccaceae bacterium]
MMPPLLVDLWSGTPDWGVFALASLVTGFAGGSLVLMRGLRPIVRLETRQAFLLTTLVWLVTTAFASLPFLFSGLNLTLADAFFEAMSGITTTGSTVITGLDEAPPGILLWRSLLQWLGGVGIIVMGVAVLPFLNVGGMQLFRTESSERTEKALPRAAQIAWATVVVYFGLTAACALAYGLAGMPVFEALTHAMTTLATGGYATSDASIAGFGSPGIEWIAILFMTLGGVPLMRIVQALRGRPRLLWRDVQVRWYLSIILCVALLLFAWVHLTGQATGHTGVRHALFSTVAVVTGTGYASVDYNGWGTFPVVVFFFLTCVGGCTGSTTGGIKVFRFVILYEVSQVQALRLIRPNGVFRPAYNGRPISDAAAISVLAFVFLFALVFAVVTALLAAMGLEFLTAMSAAITALANVGPGLGEIVGPAGNFASIPDGAKWILAFAMLLGRLELFTVLILFTPAFWRG